MLSHLSIRLRVVGGFCVLLILAAAVILPAVNYYLKELIQSAETRELKVHYEELQGRIDAEQRLATAMAMLVASQPHIQELLKQQNREMLNAEFEDAFSELASNFGLRQFQFHTPPATSWLRIHRPEKFGDDLSSFRQTVVETNRRQQPVSGVEKGVAGLGIRGIVPMMVEGRHWGSVEFGFSLGDSVFEQFKTDTGLDISLALKENNRLELFSATLGDNLVVSTTQLDSALNNDPQTSTITLDEKPYALYSQALQDFSGERIGVMTLFMDRSEYVNRYEQALFQLTMIILGFLVLGGLVAILISQSVVKPLRRVQSAMKDISSGEGDLTQRLPEEGRNELTEIAQEFNHFIGQIEQLIKHLMRSVASVSSSGSHLFDVSDHTLELTNRQRQETTEIATAMNEMAATAVEVSKSASGSATVTQQADEQAVIGRNVVDEAITAIYALADDVASMVTVIKEVENSSDQIHSILDVIRDIADQTNLLALNAAIEAARAGDQGRGFAVVADEVRALAHRTQKSTTEVNEMIDSLKEGTNRTVAVIEQSKEQSELTVAKATRAGEALQAITQAMDEIRDMTAQIAAASEEQTQVSETISESVTRISVGSDETSEGASDILNSIATIGTELSQLMGVIRRFKVEQDDVIELEVARAAHQAWKLRLRAFLDGKIEIPHAQAVSPRECDFGRWFYGAGQEKLGNSDIMRSIEQPHNRMHQLIAEIIDAKSKNQMQEAESKYHEVGLLSDKVVEQINLLIAQSK